MFEKIGMLGFLAVVAFIQNMMFTLTSRSRNSADPNYHRYCAWGSNGIWYLCFLFIWANIWTAAREGSWWYIGVIGIVYTIATAEGSVYMMKRLLKREKGKRRVGARG